MMHNATRSHPDKRTVAGFLKEESGSVTIFAIAGFAMCMVVAGLAFDVGRVMSIHTQASSYADQTALAAASELDSRFTHPGDNALTRAVNAATGLGVGQRITMGGDGNLRVASLRFFSSIAPPPGTNPIARSPWPGDTLTATWTPGGGGGGTWAFQGGFNFRNASLESHYVLVDLQTVNEPYTLLPMAGLFGGASQSGVNLAPQAMAGFERRMCDITPIMVCNPLETAGGPASQFDPTVEDDYTFVLQGARRESDPNDRWVPGVYSFLETSNTSAGALRNYIRNADPGTACYGDTSRVLRSPNAGDGNGNNNTRYQIGRGWNERLQQGLGNSNRKRFPVAVVNCLHNVTALRNRQPVPIVGYAQAELLPEDDSDPDVAVDLGSSRHDDEIKLKSRGIVWSTNPPEHMREYSVLVR